MSVPENSRIWALHGYGQSPSMLLKALDKVKSTWYRQHDGKVPANQQVIAPKGIFVPPFAAEARERLASGEQFADDKERQKLVAVVSLRGWWFLDYDKMHLEPPVLVVPTVDQMMAVLQEGTQLVAEFGQPDTVVGFSQGASTLFLWMYYGIITPKRAMFINTFIDPRIFAVVDSIGTYSAVSSHTLVSVPSCHFFGARDDLVAKFIPMKEIATHDHSIASYFLPTAADPQELRTVFIHPDGHVIPTKAEAKKAFDAFLLPIWKCRNLQNAPFFLTVRGDVRNS